MSQVKLLGVLLTNDLKWQGHIDSVCGKGSSRVYVLRMLRRAGVDPKDIVAIYVALIHSILEYACHVWHTGLTAQQSDQLELGAAYSALRVAYPDHPHRATLSSQDSTLSVIDKIGCAGPSVLTFWSQPTYCTCYCLLHDSTATFFRDRTK